MDKNRGRPIDHVSIDRGEPDRFKTAHAIAVKADLAVEEWWHVREGDRLHGASGIAVEGAVDEGLDLGGERGEWLEPQYRAVLAVRVDGAGDAEGQLLVRLHDLASVVAKLLVHVAQV